MVSLVVLINFFLMADDVEHFSVCLFAIKCVSFFGKMSQIFCTFKIVELFVFFLLGFQSFLYMLDRSCLSHK